jgi:hypothetical protein
MKSWRGRKRKLISFSTPWEFARSSDGRSIQRRERDKSPKPTALFVSEATLHMGLRTSGRPGIGGAYFLICAVENSSRRGCCRPQIPENSIGKQTQFASN